MATLSQTRGGSLTAALHLSSGPGWITLHRGKELAFQLKTSSFAGRASLWTENSGKQISFGLENARHLGLDLEADLTVELWEEAFGIQAAIHHHGLNVLFRGFADDWLSGRGLRARLTSPMTLLNAGEAKITVSPGPIALSGDGTLHFTGTTSAHFHRAAFHVSSSDTHLQLPLEPPSDSSVSRRSSLRLIRHSQHWPIKPPRGKWSYPADDLFDLAVIEAEEDDRGRRHHRATFTSTPGRAPFGVALEKPLHGTDGRAVALPMSEPRYTVDLTDGAQTMEAQLAESQSMRFGPLQLLLRPPTSQPALQASHTSCCIIAEGALAGDIDNAVLAPSEKSPSWHVAVTADDEPVGNYSQATIQMAGKNPVLQGALQFRVLRPQDALDLCLRVTNVELRVGGAGIGSLELAHNASDPSDFSLLIADLPPQALIMPKINSSSPSATDDCSADLAHYLPPQAPPDALQSRVAAPSRVSMRLLSQENWTATLDLELLLDWAQYPLNIAPCALKKPDAGCLTTPGPIPDSATEIVAPPGLSFSPDEDHAFFSSDQIRADDGVNQIWTARLSKRIAPAPDSSADGALSHFPLTPDRRPTMRALRARSLADPDRYVLLPADLEAIVNHLAQTPASASHCVLSSLGAWLDIRAAWPPDACSRSSFKEAIAGLLEQHAEMTYEGVLVPSGHRVTVVKSGKLQWCRDGLNVLVARFIERFKIVYHQPAVVSYDVLRNDSANGKNLQFPFNSITLIGKETPYLEASTALDFTSDCGTCNPHPKEGYWTWILPNLAGAHVPFPFPVELVDRANVKHRTTMEMMVACYAQSWDPDYNGKILQLYQNPPAGVEPGLGLNNERVAYARPTKMGNTSYPTGKMTLTAMPFPDLAAAKKNGTFPWYPQMKDTELALEQVSAFSNPPLTASSIPKFQFAQVYKDHPFDDSQSAQAVNRAEVILSLSKDPTSSQYNPVPLNFNGALGGGLAKPSTKVIGLARKTGTVLSSDQNKIDHLEDYLTNIGNQGMKVADMFKSMEEAASLLGAVDLAEVLDEVSDGVAQASKLPLMAVQQLQTLEKETIQKLQDLLKPIFDFQKQAMQFYQNVNQSIADKAAKVRTAIRTATSLVRVLATEQRPSDVSALVSQSFDTTVKDLTNNLIPRLNLSALQRIQTATQPPLEANILPTLYQIRDYALNAVLAETTPAVQQFTDELDNALTAGEDAFNKALDNASTAAGTAIGDLAGSLIFQFASAGDTLLKSISSADVAGAVQAFETVSDIAAAIPTLDKSRQQLQTDITTSLNTTSADCGVGALRQRAAAMTAAVNNASAALPPAVKLALETALKPSGTIEAACTNILQTVTNAVNDATQFVQTVLDEEEQLRQAFLDAQSQIQDAITQVRQLLTIPQHIKVNYSYQTTLRDAGPFVAEFHGNRSTFNLQASVLVNLDGSPPQFDISAEVANFSLNLIPSFQFVIIGFETTKFESHNGGSPTVHCPINAGNIQLVGPLNFVKDLADKLDLPPFMVVQVVGATATVGLNISLPSVTCGAFNITGLSVFTAVSLDFTGKPLRAIFGFANPNQHFTMTYLFLGGGGFINLEFVPSGQTAGMTVTAALEGGAMAALDFGVASGEVHIFAGIYMSLRPHDVLLSGYFRAGGELDVLEIISVSVEFIMSLSYENRGGTAWLSGDCEVDVDVEVAFVISVSVSLHMHHDFSGSSGS